MLSELECGICYRIFNGNRRCPRQLQCNHSFCESCLQMLAARQTDDPQQVSVTCAFCRHTSTLTDESPRANFPVDENILQRVMEAGVLEGSPSNDDDDDEETNKQCSDEDLPRNRRSRLWNHIKRICKKVRGSNQQGCITNAEMKDLALMSCYIM